MADRGASEAGRDDPDRLPARDEAWAEFWRRLAEIWVDLPPETQRRLAERVAASVESPGWDDVLAEPDEDDPNF